MVFENVPNEADEGLYDDGFIIRNVDFEVRI